MSHHCEMCDVAWALGMSEKGFFEQYDRTEREQLVATYRSQAHRETVQGLFPVKAR